MDWSWRYTELATKVAGSEPIRLQCVGLYESYGVVGPCHHCMARPQVADRGTASNMEGSCE